MKIAVVGTRSGTLQQKRLLFEYLSRLEDYSIVSGGCSKGADNWAEEYAKRNEISIKLFLPKGHNASDYHNRNSLIALDCDELIAVLPNNPDMKRYAGTEQTLREAEALGKKCTIIDSDNEIGEYKA